jgi:large subunit ribosomal protein L17
MALIFMEKCKFLNPFMVKYSLNSSRIINKGIDIQKQYEKSNSQIIAMRHGLRTNRLGRPSDQRKALIRCLVTELLTHGKIETTLVRAKYIRRSVDKIISLSIDGGLHSKRQIENFIYNKKLVDAIVKEAPRRYSDRNGGYSRVVPLVDYRRGDSAKMATIELL